MFKCFRETVLLLGDSYAAFAFDNLELFCTNRDVVNLGVAGMTAATWRSHMISDAFPPPCLAEPDVSAIWVAVGGNDFMLRNCDTGTGFIATLTSDLNALIVWLLAQFPGADVVLTGCADLYSCMVPSFNFFAQIPQPITTRAPKAARLDVTARRAPDPEYYPFSPPGLAVAPLQMSCRTQRRTSAGVR